MNPLNSFADWQGLLTHRMYQLEQELNSINTTSPNRMDVVEMVEDFLSDADIQIKQLCNRAKSLSKLIHKMPKE